MTAEQFRTGNYPQEQSPTQKRTPIVVNDKGQNKLEAAYAQHLTWRLSQGEVRWFGFECVKLVLAPKTVYIPDFMVLMQDGSMEVHETKGFWRDDARVKIKVAARLFPCWLFLGVTRKGHNDAWHYERFPRV